MIIQKGICEECKKEYEYDYNPEFPRKYCPDCSAKKKAEYKARNKTSVPIVPATLSIPDDAVPREVAKHDIVISRTEKPHSYEFGKAEARHKIYYENVNELQEHIRMLKAENLVPPNPFLISTITRPAL